jgi:tetratricopeptide (TPR) repeat protein
MTAIKMLSAHRYEEALKKFEEELAIDPRDNGALAGHARALQCLGHYAEALEELKKANAVEASYGTRTPHYLQIIGGLQWLLGRQTEAIQTFKTGMDGILDGSIQFSDAAGGISHGLLMWYAGISALDRGAQDYAYNYLRKLGKGFRAGSWPGPIGHFILGRNSREEVLEAACETHELAEAIKAAKTDLLKRRQLVQALFYFATWERAEGREEECLSLMRQCAELENPIIEIEWFLARGEVTPKSIFRDGRTTPNAVTDL